MQNEIMVSIACITYNHENYIRDAIESFLMQKTNFKFEILIHDDASTDGTPDIIKEYQEKYPDIIKPILQTENQYSQGIKINLTYNYPRAKGKYIALCEGDDFWIDPKKLQKQVEYLEQNPSCTLCCHGAEIIDENNKKTYKLVRPCTENAILPMDLLIMDGGCIPTASFVLPKKLIINVPDYLYSAPVGDYPLQMFLGSLGYVYYIDNLMSVYRTGDKNSWTMRTFKGENSREKSINHNKAMLELLDSFNAQTNFRYSASVEKAKVMREFRIHAAEGKLKKIKNGKYKNYYNSLGYIEKVKLHTRCYFPDIYKKMNIIKKNIICDIVRIKNHLNNMGLLK